MRPVSVSLAAAGVSPWIPVNRLQNAFGIGLGVFVSGTLTAAVQFTMDPLDIDAADIVTISRASTTATVIHPGHQMATGDSAIITSTGSSNLDKAAGVTVTVVDANTYTYTVVDTGATADTGFAKSLRLRIFTHATLTGLTARANGNFAYPVSAVRLAITAFTSGTADLIVQQGMGR